MVWLCPSIPCCFLDYLCVGGQGHWAPPGWPSGRRCSESSTFQSFPSTQPTRTPGEEQFLNRWRSINHHPTGQMCGVNMRLETEFLNLALTWCLVEENQTKNQGRVFIYRRQDFLWGSAPQPSTTCSKLTPPQLYSVEQTPLDVQLCLGRKTQWGQHTVFVL